MRIATREDADKLRAVLAPIWTDYYRANGTPNVAPSTNMCCLTAAMIAEIDPDWTVVHGTVNGEAHAWCESSVGTVLDLTADQFGGPTLVWGDRPSAYLPASDAVGECPGCACLPLPDNEEDPTDGR